MRPSMTGSLAFSVLAALGVLAAPRASFAQSRASDVAAAQALFDEARGLIKAGKFTEACPKLEESERLDAGPGTEFNLADCYEHAGRTASAWAEFAAVADSLHALGQRDREKFARDRATALQPKLTKLAISVTTLARIAGLEVKRDGEVLRDAQWGSGVPVDPGKHTIAAAAPGRIPWQQTVDVTGEGKTVAVDVPMLSAQQVALAQPPAPVPVSPPPQAPAVSPASSAPAPEAESSHGPSGRRVAALVVGGLGIVGLGVGGYFGSQAISKHSAYVPHCPNSACDPAGLQLHGDAASDAMISTVMMALGAVAVAGGVVLWITAPPAKSAAPQTGVHVLPSVSARGGGLFLQGAW